MRVFLAVTENNLRALRDNGRVDAPLTGFTATADLVDRLGLEGEELDLALTLAAAEVSRDVVLEAGASQGRRLVVVAEIPDAGVRVDSEPAGEVTLRGALEIARVDAILADVVPLDLASTDDESLAWFAVQKIQQLL